VRHQLVDRLAGKVSRLGIGISARCPGAGEKAENKIWLRINADKKFCMKANDFRRIALSLEGAEESSHMGAPDFRVGGRIFATLASERQGYGNLMLTPEQQAAFVEEAPELFVPIAGGWGRNGATHIRLGAASEDVLAGALRAAWQIRVAKNRAAVRKSPRKTKN
jgi:hypothetical protein